MAYMFRKKHALSGFAMLLFFCTLWMLHQQDEISQELSTSSDDDLLPAHILYPVGELQYKKEQQRIILEQMEDFACEFSMVLGRGESWCLWTLGFEDGHHTVSATSYIVYYCTQRTTNFQPYFHLPSNLDIRFLL